MKTRWEELTPNGSCRRLTRSVPDGAMWVGYGGLWIRHTAADGSVAGLHLPFASFADHVLDCDVDGPGGCTSIEVAEASAEKAVRRRLEENVEAMGGRVTWEKV